MDSGQKCAVASCEAKGEPSRTIPGSAWCAEHVKIEIEDRVRIWRAAVQANEERERGG